MDDFDNVFLTFRERVLLFLMRFTKRMPEKYLSPCHSTLLKYGFILPNKKKVDESKLNWENEIPDGTYFLADKARRYRIYVRKQRHHRYLTPVIVAFLTSLATNLLKELWLPAL